MLVPRKGSRKSKVKHFYFISSRKTRWWFQKCFGCSPRSLGKWSKFDYFFQLGWNHDPEKWSQWNSARASFAPRGWQWRLIWSPPGQLVPVSMHVHWFLVWLGKPRCFCKKISGDFGCWVLRIYQLPKKFKQQGEFWEKAWACSKQHLFFIGQKKLCHKSCCT